MIILDIIRALAKRSWKLEFEQLSLCMKDAQQINPNTGARYLVAYRENVRHIGQTMIRDTRVWVVEAIRNKEDYYSLINRMETKKLWDRRLGIGKIRFFPGYGNTQLMMDLDVKSEIQRVNYEMGIVSAIENFFVKKLTPPAMALN